MSAEASFCASSTLCSWMLLTSMVAGLEGTVCPGECVSVYIKEKRKLSSCPSWIQVQLQRCNEWTGHGRLSRISRRYVTGYHSSVNDVTFMLYFMMWTSGMQGGMVYLSMVGSSPQSHLSQEAMFAYSPVQWCLPLGARAERRFKLLDCLAGRLYSIPGEKDCRRMRGRNCRKGTVRPL